MAGESGGAPAGAAPAPGVQAPGQQASPTGAEGGEKAAEKAPSLIDELGGLFKKHGGIKYKWNGKESTIDDPNVLIRRLSNVEGLEASANELAKLKGETQRERELRGKLKGEKNPRERVKLLRELAGDESSFDEAAEASVLERFERERQKQQLTPREREAHERAEAAERKANQLEEESNRTKAEREKQEEEQTTRQLQRQIFSLAGQALQKVGVKPEFADRYLPSVAGYIYEAAQKGLEVAPEDIVDFIVTQRETENGEWLGAKSDDALLDMLEKTVDEKGVSRAKKLAALIAKRLQDAINKSPGSGMPSLIPNGHQPPAPNGKASNFTPSYWNTVQKK